ncbi:MAG: DNA-directed RNA polymerase subunit omega [Oligoflexales bacterium]
MARVSIEDCLQFIENRFALVSIASHRTRQLMTGKTPLVKTKNKEAVTALREIAEGLIVGNKEIDYTAVEEDLPPSARKPLSTSDLTD